MVLLYLLFCYCLWSLSFKVDLSLKSKKNERAHFFGDLLFFWVSSLKEVTTCSKIFEHLSHHNIRDESKVSAPKMVKVYVSDTFCFIMSECNPIKLRPVEQIACWGCCLIWDNHSKSLIKCKSHGFGYMPCIIVNEIQLNSHRWNEVGSLLCQSKVPLDGFLAMNTQLSAWLLPESVEHPVSV